MDYPDNNITWEELKELGYEKPASGRVLRGEVIHKQTKYWPNSKQVKVRDARGTARAVFFYPAALDPPLDYDDIQQGSAITLRSPRLHYFMDGQDGIRCEDAAQVVAIEQRKVDSAQRMVYAVSAKELGNELFKGQKFEAAVDQYRIALDHVSGAQGEEEGKRAELRIACHLNLAACAHGLKQYAAVEAECLAALQDSPASAKAHFRIGQAAVGMGQFDKAVSAFSAAHELAPEDKKVASELGKAKGELENQRRRERKMWTGILAGGGSPSMG